MSLYVKGPWQDKARFFVTQHILMQVSIIYKIFCIFTQFHGFLYNDRKHKPLFGVSTRGPCFRVSITAAASTSSNESASSVVVVSLSAATSLLLKPSTPDAARRRLRYGNKSGFGRRLLDLITTNSLRPIGPDGLKGIRCTLKSFLQNACFYKARYRHKDCL